MAAISTAVLSQIKSGEHMISINQPYTGTDMFMKNILPNYNINITFINGEKKENFEKNCNQETYEIEDLIEEDLNHQSYQPFHIL